MNDTDAKVIQHDEQIKTLFNRVDKVEKVTTEIYKMGTNVERLTINQTVMLEQLASLKKDVDEIKNQPIKDLHEIKQKVIIGVITAIVGIIIGAFFTLILK